MRRPFFSSTTGVQAASSFSAEPAVSNCASRRYPRVETMPSRCWSRQWLLAKVATSTPTRLRAASSGGWALNTMSPTSGFLSTTMGVSRLTMAKSARCSTGESGPST